MGRKGDINSNKKAQIKILLDGGKQSIREIAALVGVSHTTIKNKKNVPIQSHRIGHCGKKKLTTSADERAMMRVISKNPTAKAKDVKSALQAAGTRLSLRTTQRRLKELGCKSVKARRVPVLTARMKKQRLEWARSHRPWTAEDWEKVKINFYSLNTSYLWDFLCIHIILIFLS